MNATTQKCGLWAALLVASTITTSAVPVTFQVNMEVQTIVGTFNPATHTVELHGSFDNWGTGITLAQSASDTNVYTGTVDLTGTAGSTVDFKYVINQAGTQVWENDGVGPGGAQNRAVTVPASEQTLPVVYFNNQSAPPGVVTVTFQVNMEIQILLGNLDTDNHTVEARGSFDNWGSGITLSKNSTNANIYQGTVDVTGSAGAPFEYKYVINRAGVLEYESAVGPGGPFGNRTFVLDPPPSQILPLVYFNNLTNNPGTGIPVTFQANMLVQYIRGAFDPATGTVDVRGPFNNWGNPPYVLTNSAANPYLFVGMLSISNASPGNTVPYKFNMNGGTWEGGNDRTFVLANSNQTLPPRYFDDTSNLGSVAITRGPAAFEVTVTWTALPRARLQSAPDLNNPVWQDVENTLGQGSATVFSADPQMMFFRLIGP
jgi:hypothetical protein